MGSPMTLKLVLRTIGTPVNAWKAAINLGVGRETVITFVQMQSLQSLSIAILSFPLLSP